MKQLVEKVQAHVFDKLFRFVIKWSLSLEPSSVKAICIKCFPLTILLPSQHTMLGEWNMWIIQVECFNNFSLVVTNKTARKSRENMRVRFTSPSFGPWSIPSEINALSVIEICIADLRSWLLANRLMTSDAKTVFFFFFNYWHPSTT